MITGTQGKSTTPQKPYMPQDASDLRKAEVLVALRLLGANEYDLLLPETRCLHQIIENHETLLGAIYGRYTRDNGKLVGRGLLVVTDKRILFIDKKPLFLKYEDINFQVVSGVQYSRAIIGETVTLETRLGNIKIRTFNDKCARQFTTVVEDMLYAQRKGWL